MIERRAARGSHREASHDGTAVRRTPSPERQAAALAGSEYNDWIAGEPTLRDLQQDPLIHAILRRDGLSLQDLLQAMAEGRRRLEPGSAAAAASGTA